MQLNIEPHIIQAANNGPAGKVTPIIIVVQYRCLVPNNFSINAHSGKMQGSLTVSKLFMGEYFPL